MNKQYYDLLESLLKEAENLNFQDGNFDFTLNRAEMLATKVFGPKTNYVQKLNTNSFSPKKNSSLVYYPYFLEGKKQLVDLIKVMMEDMSLSMPEKISDTESLEKPVKKSLNIFIVHGHDDLAKVETARFIEQLGFIPIILHEQASSGSTIIEKIENYSNVGFGVILYTPCDIGAKKGKETELKFRARQNVVFEHGYLIGKIGRKNVAALVKGDVEPPNDISGVVYISMENEWKMQLAKELRNSGYPVDMNKVI